MKLWRVLTGKKMLAYVRSTFREQIDGGPHAGSVPPCIVQKSGAGHPRALLSDEHDPGRTPEERRPG